jgi:hypothetical protein
MNHALPFRFALGTVDRTSGIIRGCSLATVGPARGHGVYCDETTLTQLLSSARSFTSGLKVKMDHGGGAGDIVGLLRDLRIEGTQLRGDLHLLRSYEKREYVLELAETMADTFGLSVAFSGPTEERSGKLFARCTEIYSCDLVADPAANPNGLFSARVDATKKEEITALTMTEAEVNTLIENALSKFNASIEALKLELADVKKQFAIASETATSAKTECSALKAELAQFSAKSGDEQKRIELTARTIAQEFSRTIGNATVQADGGGTAGGKGDAVKVDVAAQAVTNFDAILTKHFGTTNSKSHAWRMAINEDPAGYKAFIDAKAKPTFETAKK